jgi:hypothetical protein
MRLTAYKGRDGTITIPIQYDPLGGADYVNLSLTSATVEFKAGGFSIDTDGVFAEISNGNEVTFELGGLALTKTAEYQALLILYNADYPNGKIIAGPGKDESIQLHFRVE